MLSPALLSSVILVITLALFISERVRHDLVAIIALVASLAFGLVAPRNALQGFADPAVIAVASVFIVGRAIELSGVASAATVWLMPAKAGFAVRMSILLVAGATLSAFMNNIAALVITMPIATEIARSSKRPPGAILMPLSFATLLGGMTTLIGTPANLIISSVRDKQLGSPFGFFSNTPVGVLVTVLGLTYLCTLGWRFLPHRQSVSRANRNPWMTFELLLNAVPSGGRRELGTLLRKTSARLLGIVRDEQILNWPDDGLQIGDRLLLLSRTDPWKAAELLPFAAHVSRHKSGVPVTRVSVAHGSPLIGRGLGAISFISGDEVHVIAGGPRAVTERQPMAQMAIQAGDQLFVEGSSDALARFTTQMRLLEIDRFDRLRVNSSKAYAIAGIFLCAILAIVVGNISPALSFLSAAALIGGFRLIPAKDIYTSIDWSVIILLAAMIPVGASFESTGAAAIVASWLGEVLADQQLVVTIGAICTVTMLLSIFLNNVATALIMAPLAIRVAELLGLDPDALLLAVLIGASSDFLTPIGHHNNLLVMGPGGYKFSDYSRVGAIMAIIVVTTSALFLAHVYG